ncbi:MAG: isoprenylcysteine carboxylmethyltransferase family protein [Caldilineaceae bacterium]
MFNETTFQIIAILLFAILATIGFSHRLRAAKAKDTINRRAEGVSLMILLRLFGLGTWAGLLTYMVNPEWMEWASMGLPVWARLSGAAAVAVGLPLIYWMFSSLGANVTDTVTIRKGHQLVMHGPYHWIRHPMYTFTLLIFIGFCLLTGNWFIGLMGMAALIMLGIRTPMEEARLVEKFGDEYSSYAAHTGRFFPRIERAKT